MITSRLTPTDFKYISEIICSCFPTDAITTYFTPCGNGQKPSGKLYDQYTNLKEKLRQCGLLPRKRKRTDVHIEEFHGNMYLYNISRKMTSHYFLIF